MVEVSLRVPVPVDQVFTVLADGWSYASWVVGAAHIREVDATWPAPGARIHHSVGPWPLQVKDVTTVATSRPPHELELEARMWPLGAATIRFELTEENGETKIRMHEKVTRGPLSLLPEQAQAVMLVPRNRESLHRLADLAVGRK
ncbi:SRPBCC family protein [Actinosynnema sp. CS-041913]|uniref:SRPBCC family protein n=1 Tax=Actinosynnema sp. CS-041913 TaxID=3239917 RepID=UPI003D89D3FD